MCATLRANNDGKLFRLDIDLGSTAGPDQRKTAYVWLCDRCAALLSPRVEVTSNSVLVRLGALYGAAPRTSGLSRARVN